eukprot:m.14316 g.14316  ORF g.14316 m.14316 type:complete len:512 (-) comp4286_c0_seq1:51-1586(-)
MSDGEREDVVGDRLFLNLLVERTVLKYFASKAKDQQSQTQSQTTSHSQTSSQDVMDEALGMIQDYLSKTCTLSATTTPTPKLQPKLRNRRTLDFMLDAQKKWRERIESRFFLIVQEYKLKLSYPTSTHFSREKFIDNIRPEPLSLTMFVYDHQDFFDAMNSVYNPNITPFHESIRLSRSIRHIMFQTPSLDELRSLFSQLSPTLLQLGTQDVIQSSNHQGLSNEIEEREEEGRLLAQANTSSECKHFCKRGCPTPFRNFIWHHALCNNATNVHKLQYEELWSKLREELKAVDHLVAADVCFITASDDNFFIFKDTIQEILLSLIRDPSQMNNEGLQSGIDMDALPSGIIPFRSMCLLVAPFTFIYRSSSLLFNVFSKMYRRYFANLHTINSHPNGILRLCETFTSLMETRLADLVLHLHSIGVNGLAIVFPWMFLAFSGYLPVSEVLFLWDRIIGFDSLYVLPLLAYAILSFRQKALFGATTKKEVEFILADFRSVSAIPLLQYALFAEDI